MRRGWRIAIAFVFAISCIGFAAIQIVIYFGPQKWSDAITGKTIWPRPKQVLIRPVAPKPLPSSRMPDVDLDALVMHVNILCEWRLAILKDPQRPFAERKEAALTIARMRYTPAIPTLIEELMLSGPAETGKVSNDFPCQQALRNLGDLSFAYLVDACRKDYPKEHRLALNKLIKQMGWKTYAEAICRSYLELPYDATTVDILNRHIRNFQNAAD